MTRCPHCNAKVVQKSLDGKVRIRTNIVAFGSGGDDAEVKCRKCGHSVPLDLQLGQELRKALVGPRLVVRKEVDSAESPA